MSNELLNRRFYADQSPGRLVTLAQVSSWISFYILNTIREHDESSISEQQDII